MCRCHFIFSIQKVDSSIKYIGVDSCLFFINMNRKRNIPVIESDIRNVSVLKDDSIDICFSRHTFEHQSRFQEILDEMIRIGKKEACHIFFIKPSSTEKISYDKQTNLYHNTYSKDDIEEHLRKNQKVLYWNWIDLNSNENALHIYLKDVNDGNV